MLAGLSVTPIATFYHLSLITLFPAVSDLKLVDDLSDGKVDLTFGRCVPSCPRCVHTEDSDDRSALDIFGGNLVSFEELVAYNTVAKKAVKQ